MVDMISAFLIAVGLTFPAQNGCLPGVFKYEDGASVVVDEPRANEAQGYRFLDGRRGSLAAANDHIACRDGTVLAGAEGAPKSVGTPVELLKTQVSFKSAGATLVGEMLRPARSTTPLPLVVMVHGSERTPAIGNRTAKLLAAQGIAVFAYDKRGTGKSGGYYTQNFELLADDAVAALRAAMATGPFAKAGYYGESQGGWVAPLAATRSPADFIVVGYGLIASPVEEDRQQMLLEADKLGLDQDAKEAISRLSDATARIIRSNFTSGFTELDEVRRVATDQGWYERIDGEYSGDMLRMGDLDLGRIGKPVFDNLELIWDYDALGALRKVTAPILWIAAGDDREAPVAPTLRALEQLVQDGKSLSSYVFPDTDHGVLEFTQDQNGKRSYTRFADGYFRLVADGILGRVRGSYGRAHKLH